MPRIIKCEPSRRSTNGGSSGLLPSIREVRNIRHFDRDRRPEVYGELIRP